MTLVKRLTKGSPLTYAEGDDNLDHVMDLANATGSLEPGKISQDETHRFWTDAEKAANTAAIAAATPLIQTETAIMVAKLIAEGSAVDNGLIIAIDNFYNTIKRSGAITKIKWLWIPLGYNLNSALVNLVAVSGVPSKLTNNNFVAADYNPKIGFGTGNTANTTKYLDAGFNPADLGLTNSAFAFGHFAPLDQINANSYFLALAPSTGTTVFAARSYPTSMFVTNNSLQNESNGAVMAIFNQASATVFQAFKYGVKVADGTSVVTSNPFLGNVNLFRGTNSGSYIFARGISSGAFISAALTESEAKSINQAIFDINVYLERINTIGGRLFIEGDSNTDGKNVLDPTLKWGNIVGQKTGLRVYCVAHGGARLASASVEKVAAYIFTNDYIDVLGNTYISMWGTNDQRGADLTTDGDATVIADFKTKYTTMVNNRIAKGQKVILISPLYNGTTNATKGQAWSKAVSDVARATGSVFVDGYNLLLDTGDPTSYLVGDILHLNNAGSKLLGERVVSSYLGRSYRSLAVDFPSIASGSFSDVTVFMGTADIGQVIVLGFSAAPTNNLDIVGFVSSADTVTIRATNNTGSTIDPASQVIKVTLLL